MFETKESLVNFIEHFSNLINPPYEAPYINENDLNNFEEKIGLILPVSFREFLLVCNFDNFQLGSTGFGNGTGSYLEHVLELNTEFSEYLKIAGGEMGGIFLSTKTGEVWSQWIDGDVITQNKLARDFEGFLRGYCYIQKNYIERTLTHDEAAKLVAKKVGSDNYKVWAHA